MCGDYNALSLIVVAGLGEWLLGSGHLGPVEEAGLAWKDSSAPAGQSVTADFSVNKVQCVICHQ